MLSDMVELSLVKFNAFCRVMVFKPKLAGSAQSAAELLK